MTHKLKSIYLYMNKQRCSTCSRPVWLSVVLAGVAVGLSCLQILREVVDLRSAWQGSPAVPEALLPG